jgi:hypothetical protein
VCVCVCITGTICVYQLTALFHNSFRYWCIKYELLRVIVYSVLSTISGDHLAVLFQRSKKKVMLLYIYTYIYIYAYV